MFSEISHADQYCSPFSFWYFLIVDFPLEICVFFFLLFFPFFAGVNLISFSAGGTDWETAEHYISTHEIFSFCSKRFEYVDCEFIYFASYDSDRLILFIWRNCVWIEWFSEYILFMFLLLAVCDDLRYVLFVARRQMLLQAHEFAIACVHWMNNCMRINVRRHA